jgi:hypothetical protein
MEEKKEYKPSYGALWAKKKDGKEYYTGKVNGVSVVVFRNFNKKSDSHPDFHIYESFSQEQKAQELPKPAQKALQIEKFEDDDISF